LNIFWVTYQTRTDVYRPEYRAYTVLKSKKDYKEFCQQQARYLKIKPEQLHIMCSSSLDFPAEYTNHSRIINLCDWIRGPMKSKANYKNRRFDLNQKWTCECGQEHNLDGLYNQKNK
jgi:hypothetical protein